MEILMFTLKQIDDIHYLLKEQLLPRLQIELQFIEQEHSIELEKEIILTEQLIDVLEEI